MKKEPGQTSDAPRRAHPLEGSPVGTQWVLKSLQGPGVLVERLYEMGFNPGEPVQLVGRAPFKGPWVVRVRNVTVALREDEAQCLRL